MIKSLSISLPLLASFLTFSQAANAGDSSHYIGGTLGYGFHEFETEKYGQASFSDSVTFDLYYRHMVNDNFGIEVGGMSGSGGAFSILSDIWNDVKGLSYRGLRTTAYARLPLGISNSLYAKAGTAYQWVDYNVRQDKETVSVSETDNGFYGAIGWEFRFRNGLALNAEYQHVPMSNLTLRSYNFGINYPF
ncbi:porin family protein [Shewanella woodyi]|uniref:OmpA domain protein transmembrane region-containing protein n=1 Tax=Shewanella woodyi (strain ATCC 51908 / MS32) TaxID=392500 RepID=B1KD67_SHEWM|nr:porin family protein [Shewanella woodyi]ACA87902.1 OmpA domain protein transmembrane region-containing protein [Shewanella woodyi ATCC 51908]